MENSNKLAENYRHNYLTGHKQTIHDYDIPLQMILKYLEGYKYDSKILDAGCGNGRYANKLLNKGYINISAVDIFENNLANINFIKASVDKLPFKDNEFVFIYSLSVIHYLDNVESGISELKRVINPGGVLVLSVFNRFSYYAIIRRIKRNIFKNSIYSLDRLHFESPNKYLDLLESYGFSIVELNGYNLPQYTQLLNFLNYKGISTAFAPKVRLTKNKLISKLKANLGYHSIIVAQSKG